MRQFISANDVLDLNQLIQVALQYKAHPLKDQQLGKGNTTGIDLS
jgi:hypothetical protein